MDRDHLERRLAEGRSFAAIGREVGLSPSTVSHWARKYGLVAATQEIHAARGPLDRAVLEQLVVSGLTVREIGVEVDRSLATVRHWLRAYGLKTVHTRDRTYVSAADGTVTSECVRHGTTTFAVRSDGGHRCLKCRSEAVSDRRRRVKEIMVAEHGGACVLCGYDRSLAALQFHHRDPGAKRFSIADRGFTYSLDRVREEVDKCVLLCANCHAEVEMGVAKIPDAAVDDCRENGRG